MRESERDELLDRARQLRQQATDAELVLWRHLRGRRMAGHKFRRQAVIEPYIVDFLCHEAKLIVEADGGQHAEQRRYDARRSAWLESKGYRVLRFWNHEILANTQSVLEVIHRALMESALAPGPLPRGEGVSR